MSHPIIPSRFRLNSKAPKPDPPPPPPNKPRPKSVPSHVKKDSSNSKINKPKSGPVFDQFSRPRRTNDKDLQEKLQLIQDLQSQVLALKADLDKAQTLNMELQSQNKKLAQDLLASDAKVAAFNTRDQSIGELKSHNFKDIQRFTANQFQHSTLKTPSPPPPPSIRLTSKAADAGRKAPSTSSLSMPPPPPPPPPMRPLARAASAPKTPAIVQFYHSLRKQEEKKEIQYKPAVTSAHSSIVGEIQNRSAHLLAIKTDIETKGDFINGLIQKVLAVAYIDIEDVLKFVDWLDAELSTLADERAVLKHFNWPERKADAIREAAIEYRGLKLLESEISSFQDDTNIPCETALKKMAILLDKSERGIGRLIKLRNSVLCSYQDWKIPTNWMLDSGIVSKIKQASMKLAKTYMRRVIMELELGRNADRESNQEALVLQGVHFAYRAHQFAGGLDSETLCAFEEIRQRVPGHLGGSREFLAAIPSS